MHKLFLRIESTFLLVLLLVLYHNFELSWKLFFVFILIPDVSMIGYLKNPKIGAYVYNLGHNYAIPVCLLIIAMATNSLFLATLAAIWAIHIAADRTMGFGLKLTKGFKQNHLSN